MNKIISIFAPNNRYVEQQEALFDELKKSGFELNFIYTLNANDPSNITAKNSYRVNPIKRDDKIAVEIVDENMRVLLKSTLIFLLDVQNFPSSIYYWKLKRRGIKAKIIGFQHGLVQRWTQNFLQPICDIYFAFGERSFSFLPKYREKSVILTGMPRLNNIQNNNLKSEYILFIAQDPKYTSEIEKMLNDLSQQLDLPVLVRDHPQFPGAYKVDRPWQIKANNATEEIASAKIVLTMHSTLVLDSIKMKKTTFVLSEELNDYPYYVQNLNASDILLALANYDETKASEWLDKAVSSRSIENTVELIKKIAAGIHPIAKKSIYTEIGLKIRSKLFKF